MAKATIEPNTCIDELPEVLELKLKLSEAQAELLAVQDELTHIQSILSPLPWSSSASPMPTELDMLRARQAEPFTNERLLMAKATILELTPQYEHARLSAREQLNEARHQARLPLLRKFARAIEAAQEAGHALRDYDFQSIQLGGQNPGTPYGLLLDELPYREGELSRVRVLLEELERRS